MPTSRDIGATTGASRANSLSDRPHPLLERESALAILAERVADASTGAGSISLISGEAGIGKTSLLKQAAVRHARAGRWIWGSCDPLFTPRALGPLHDAARQLGGVLAERLFTGAPRESIFSGLLAAIDEEQGVTVLVIEDLHWADQATLDLLLFVGRRIAARPVALLLSYRDDESASDPLFHATMGSLPPDLVQRIPLAPLSPDAVATLAAHAGRSGAGLHEATGGNPFFVTEMLAGDGLGITATLRDAVLARVRPLSSAARDALDLIAVIPRAAELDLLERQLGVAANAGQQAIVVCTIDAVWLGTHGGADGVTATGLPPLGLLINEFVASGGAIWLCGACTKPRGISEAQVANGACIVGAARIVEAVVGGAATMAFA